MNSPIEFGGSQVMLNGMMKNKIKFNTLMKWLLGISIVVLLFHFPDVFGHSILWVVHTFYEATSFLCEHFLMHTFGFDKPLAQLIVFYFSIVTGLGTSMVIWRFWLKGYLIFKFNTYKNQTLNYWHSKRRLEKIKLMLIYTALMVSTFMLLGSM